MVYPAPASAPIPSVTADKVNTSAVNRHTSLINYKRYPWQVQILLLTPG